MFGGVHAEEGGPEKMLTSTGERQVGNTLKQADEITGEGDKEIAGKQWIELLDLELGVMEGGS